MGLLNFFTEKCECSVCGELKNNLLLQSIYDGKICSSCLKKVGYDGDISNLSIRSAYDRCSLFDQLDKQKKISKMPPYPYTSVEEYEMACRADKYIYTAKYQNLTDSYYDDLSKIDTLWSILSNLKDFNGKKAKDYETLCLKNINTFKRIYEEYNIPYNTTGFDCVPAYKRLSMLYEKQKRYEDATLVCLDAIQHGAQNEYGDGGSGKMYARLARMAKKANLLDDKNIKMMINKQKI